MWKSRKINKKNFFKILYYKKNIKNLSKNRENKKV